MQRQTSERLIARPQREKRCTRIDM